jgi:hypothetical protein
MASIEFITKEDLLAFKADLLSELKSLFQPQLPGKKQWLKSREVRALLGISPGTLQNLRINGKIKFTKIGGTIFYSRADISQLFKNGKDVR